jgi:phosphoglycolate phosphatase-like HAD superfamily hydrolase
MKLFLFDIDGTLIQSGGAGKTSLAKSFRKTFDCEESVEGVFLDGKTDPVIIKEIFSKKFPQKRCTKSIVNTVLDNYLSYLRMEVAFAPRYKVLSGVLGTLKDLAESKGTYVGLATGNIEEGAKIKLDRANLNRFFHFGAYGSDSSQREKILKIAAKRGFSVAKETIAKDQTYVVGDTPDDVIAAKKAGFKSVAIASGRFSKKELAKEKPDYLFDDFTDFRREFVSGGKS